MLNISSLNTSLLNQLKSEILVFDKGLNVRWLNDSAISSEWKLIKKEPAPLSTQLESESLKDFNEIISDTIKNKNTSTKRDFKINFNSNKNRIVDLTASWSDKYSIVIVEILCVDNLNKIIDSTKTFSTQKIAANLARTLAHEVKNPLSGIKGSAQILSNKLSDDFSKKFLKIIIDETERLNGIVTKILTPPKKPKLVPFNIHSAFEKVFGLAEAESENFNNLELKRDYDPSIPELNGDEDLFIQAILNIVKNAQEALMKTEKPIITIKSRISYGQPINGYVYGTLCNISVIDNGPGIPIDIHDQLFFPMVSSKEDGSGIGLSISQDIIRIHGGAINFNSKPGQTIFSILIPLSVENKEIKSA